MRGLHLLQLGDARRLPLLHGIHLLQRLGLLGGGLLQAGDAAGLLPLGGLQLDQGAGLRARCLLQGGHPAGRVAGFRLDHGQARGLAGLHRLGAGNPRREVADRLANRGVVAKQRPTGGVRRRRHRHRQVGLGPVQLAVVGHQLAFGLGHRRTVFLGAEDLRHRRVERGNAVAERFADVLQLRLARLDFGQQVGGDIRHRLGPRLRLGRQLCRLGLLPGNALAVFIGQVLGGTGQGVGHQRRLLGQLARLRAQRLLGAVQALQHGVSQLGFADLPGQIAQQLIRVDAALPTDPQSIREPRADIAGAVDQAAPEEEGHAGREALQDVLVLRIGKVAQLGRRLARSGRGVPDFRALGVGRAFGETPFQLDGHRLGLGAQ
ncbi:hypothetical protein D3C78_223160 [compost metagenome]